MPGSGIPQLSQVGDVMCPLMRLSSALSLHSQTTTIVVDVNTAQMWMFYKGLISWLVYRSHPSINEIINHTKSSARLVQLFY